MLERKKLKSCSPVFLKWNIEELTFLIMKWQYYAFVFPSSKTESSFFSSVIMLSDNLKKKWKGLHNENAF